MFSATFAATALPFSIPELKQKALAWANQFRLVAFYTSNQIDYPFGGFEELLAVSSDEPIPFDAQETFESLRSNLQAQQTTWCGFLNYDLKNQTEKLSSNNPDHIGFPSIFFFEPEVYVYFNTDIISINSSANNINFILSSILQTEPATPSANLSINVQQRVSKEKYIANVERVRAHILEGDVYELNYCMEFYAKEVTIQPLALYQALNEASPTPFSGYLKYEDKYLLCASPERFLKKDGATLISQPIKGTIRRGATPEEDQQLQHQLRHDEKELAENMMIVDLVRNDLSRSCATGTVKVTEMFGIYGFRQVSQMISTITGQLRPENDLVEALKGTFPMGSMTGAPKISAMQLIEELEDTKRGLYSGAFGYIKPNQDCDFNVVIRSIQYNASTSYLSFMVGSAITFDSDPEQEYAECLLKAQAILKVLS
ncbi:anthranilate synthase component I family protein [Pontibacter arcticus]|uniref:Para-aminobenzoate synthase n=1 Tax=Pontibacter arcticus TaxID=2080288 RepID=A0A364RG35_9BACT|nr:anthranilate synthase component I family protein [Pontibacter arcticus]RAU83261.1 para-aminobenzoate synthase [Pontibacter arcticus]